MADEPKQMTDAELASALKQYARAAVGAEDSELSERRTTAMEYYKGELKDVPSEEGWSSITSRDLSEVVNWILPSLMRVFAGSDTIAEFEAKTSDPFANQAAKEATDYLNYLFLNDCDGYKILYNAIFEGLLYGNGLGKVWFDKTPVYEVDDYTGLTEQEYYQLTEPDNVEILQHSEEQTDQLEPVLDETGQPVADEMGQPLVAPVILHDIKIRKEKSRGRIKVEGTPPEEVIVKEGAEELRTTDYVSHRYREKRGVLVAMDWDNDKAEEIIKRAPRESNFEDSEEYLERHEDNEPLFGDIADDWASEEIEVIEHYVRVDFDGDGWPEWRKVVTIGQITSQDILANDEWSDDHCFWDLVPDPRPHRWDGRSILDDIEDIQQQKTLLMRGINDNIALVNHPDQIASAQIENKDALANPAPGRVLYTTGDTRAAMSYSVTPFIGPQAFQVISYYDEQRERRTGVSRQSMALDPDTLQRQTATAANIQESASQARNEIRAKNIAQYGGVQRLFKMLYKLARRHMCDEMEVKTANGFTRINPRNWPAEMDVVVTVGLGSGSRDKDLQTLLGVAQKQEQILMQLGPQNPIVSIDQYARTLQKIAEVSGIRNPEAYFKLPTPEDLRKMQKMQEAQGQQPDPAARKAEAELRMKAQEAQMTAQLKEEELARKTDVARAESETRMRIKQEKLVADLENTRTKHQLEIELAREKASQEFELRRMEITLEAELTREANQMNAAINASQTADTNLDRQAK